MKNLIYYMKALKKIMLVSVLMFLLVSIDFVLSVDICDILPDLSFCVSKKKTYTFITKPPEENPKPKESTPNICKVLPWLPFCKYSGSVQTGEIVKINFS